MNIQIGTEQDYLPSFMSMSSLKLVPIGHPHANTSLDMIKLRYTQTTDYNCGPTALAFLLGVHVDQIDIVPCRETGTSPSQIIRFVQKTSLKYGTTENKLVPVQFPMLVNFTPQDDEGHYGVILKRTEGHPYWMFDPWDGEVHKLDPIMFGKRWFSKRYGRDFGLWLEGDYN